MRVYKYAYYIVIYPTKKLRNIWVHTAIRDVNVERMLKLTLKTR